MKTEEQWGNRNTSQSFKMEAPGKFESEKQANPEFIVF